MHSASAPSTADGVGGAPTVRKGDVRWVMTAPQTQPRHTRSRLPWGTVHIRPNGSHRTACGAPTALWHTFWEIPVDTRSAQMCRECAKQATARLHDTAGAR
jgi:hypothetical protein